MVEERNNLKKVRTGVVVSDKMDKSISVLVVRKIKHPTYKKFYNRSKKYIAHDPENTCKEGDTVKISECRKLSKTKSWYLVEVVERKK
ncbi:TPA: 30S ribosomal protein S17 [Candidatus Delongbacteria bacterium]|nr:ribosomal protein S17 [uncultured bacterium]OGE85933.1 MAG: 30S ribosomal protein S17 [Candidatus Delongbacteria bacterium GWF2_40_14]HAQ61156.1 30S ribosomal protein S17 [Candidatus Delongbacteria bacterium]